MQNGTAERTQHGFVVQGNAGEAHQHGARGGFLYGYYNQPFEIYLPQGVLFTEPLQSDSLTRGSLG